MTTSEAQTLKNAFVNSMKKWNDVYFYSYKQDGTKSKEKVINIVEGSSSDYDIIIYPEKPDYSSVAGTNYIGAPTSTEIKSSNVEHNHYLKFYIKVNIGYFKVGLKTDIYGNNVVTQNDINHLMDRTGAHEIGHILGLDDMDVCCPQSTGEGNYHHEELLMGYAKNGNFLTRQQNITYKDLAGVAITRGFHTDSDHRWLVDTDQLYNGQYKKICSICNGIEYVSSLSGNYYEYNYCQGVHTLSSNNMMAVGCNGDKDYIKCKYCRYVAPVEDMVTQNYNYQLINSSTHRITNNVSGLNYTITEEHNYSYSLYSATQHKCTCTCGKIVYERHSITEADYTDGDNIAICIQCRKIINLDDGMFPVLPTSITKYSINGSYILPNGIVVLVEEDIQSYINNTLIFYEEENLPQIE